MNYAYWQVVTTQIYNLINNYKANTHQEIHYQHTRNFLPGLFLSPWSFSCFLKTVHVYIPKHSSIVCLSSNFFCFGHTMWLVESQFSVQGLNTGPQQWKCWTFRDLPELYVSGITPYDPFCVFYFLTCF